jgi:hypothetical protein
MHASEEQLAMSKGGLNTHTIATGLLLAFTAVGNGIIVVVVCCCPKAICVDFIRISTAFMVSLGRRSRSVFR